MRIFLAIATVIAISDQVQQVSGDFVKPLSDLDNLYKHHGYVDNHLRRSMDAIINHRLYHVRNVVASPTSSPTSLATPPSTPTPSTDAPIEPQGWDNQTQAACVTALSGHVNATNASGMAVCYNIPYFNNATGAFEADLRLYRVAIPSGEWAGLNQQGVSVGLSYPGAAVAASSAPAKRNNDFLSWPPIRRDKAGNVIITRSARPPQMLQVLDFVGMINGNLIGQSNEDQQWQSLLLPQITLSGMSQNGTLISTTLSSNDASFVNGVFAKQQQKTTSTTASTAAASPSHFVLPGTHLGIFPIGLIITSGWTVLFIATVGCGTVGRIRFREQYRRRIRRARMGFKTI